MYRVIIVGVGGIGSAACYRAAKSAGGARGGGGILGIEQFELFHGNGESQDHSRIIRRAQHQEMYAALAGPAYEAWDQVERESAQRLVTKTGGLVIEAVADRAGLATGTRNIAGYVSALRRQGVPFEVLGGAEVEKRWPQFRMRGDEQAVYQEDSGIVDARRANAVHVALARGNGADIVDKTPVRALHPTAHGVEVVTDTEVFRAERVITTAGAWTNELLPGLMLPLRVTQEQVTYYSTPNLAEFSPGRFPVFMWHGRHNFYGFPVYGEVATKLGQHMGGPDVTARTRDFAPDPGRLSRQRAFLAEHLPGFGGPELYTKTCLYTIPPDQDFVLGPVPGEPQITVFVGAGHAYKFAALLGQMLASLALTGSSPHSVGPFRLDRPALVDRAFVPVYHV
jgi:sarcosine oxidase